MCLGHKGSAMKKFANHLLITVSTILITPAVQAQGGNFGLQADSYISGTERLFAEAQFLPEAIEKDINFAGRDMEKKHPKNNCEAYPFTKSRCPAPREVFTPCPSDSKKFKECKCDTSKYIYSAANCIYKATTPFYPNDNRLLGDTCKDSENGSLLAKDCNCKYFRYTTNASCGQADKVVDPRSYCEEKGGEIRYEACQCNREVYPYLFTGKFYSQDFLDDVKINCGNEKNFISCQNFGNEIAYKCAVDRSYKYDDENCQKENPLYGATGLATIFTNGYGEKITLYKECDCPATYSSSCNGRSGSEFYTKDGRRLECRRRKPQCQQGFFRGMSDIGLALCAENVHGSLIQEAETCVKRDGSKVYRCECRYRHGNWDYSGNFCGDCNNITDHIYCLENGNSISNSCLK